MPRAARVLSLRLIYTTTLELVAHLHDGRYDRSFYDLDTGLGNNHGHFDMNGIDFSRTARYTKLAGTTIKAQLRRWRRSWKEAMIMVRMMKGAKSGQYL